jgi:hypothetical protein
MRRPLIIGILSGILFFVGIFLLSLLLIKILWSWTIPDLMPGAVEQGLVARSISWVTSLKLAIFIAVLAWVTGIRKSGK